MEEGLATLHVQPGPGAGRLDTFLRERFPGMSRACFQRLIEEGHVRVNGKEVKCTHRPRAGEVVEIRIPPPEPDSSEPEAMPMEIIHEDDDVLVINKSAGVVVHPAAGHAAGTLVNGLLYHCGGTLSGIGGIARPGIVHRLDKDTSGCLVVAKHDRAHVALTAQFAERSVLKIYEAIVCGRPPSREGEICTGIARHPSHRKKMAVFADKGKEARTSFKVLEGLKASALVEARLHTGRTHQIRLHFEHGGFPLVGDAVYGARANRRIVEATGYRAPRQMLHASALGIHLPGSGEWRVFNAPRPGDFEIALDTLRGKRD